MAAICFGLNVLMQRFTKYFAVIYANFMHFEEIYSYSDRDHIYVEGNHLWVSQIQRWFS